MKQEQLELIPALEEKSADITIYERLAKVQNELHAPKGLNNDFGGYKYRSAESILEAVKPLLAKNNLVLTITDELVPMMDRIYIKAIAKVMDNTGNSIETTAYAKEELVKKGMDSSQITGSCSSYARKYALNGLFAIDNTADSDSTNDGKPVMVSEAQLAELRELKVNEAGLCRAYNVKKLEDLTANDAQDAIQRKRSYINENRI